jgi:acyl carrier protein
VDDGKTGRLVGIFLLRDSQGQLGKKGKKKMPEPEEVNTETEEEPELTSEEQLRKEEEELGIEPSPENELGEESEELDWDELQEKYPKIKELGYKNVGDIIDRHFGGLPELEANHEIVSNLTKRGYDTPEKRMELFRQIDQGILKKHETPEQEKVQPADFKASRKERLAEYVKAQKFVDPKTGEPIVLTDQDIHDRVNHLEQFFDLALPPGKIEKIDQVGQAVEVLEENIFWELYKSSSKEPISDSVRQEITDKLVNEYPATALEIVQKARKAGRNWWSDLHSHYVAISQKEKINKAKTEREKEKKEEEAKKRLKAKTETPRKVSVPGKDKTSKTGIDWEAREEELRREEETIT